ncbi:MAG: ankyrin repeat domain-containing protein [Thermostichus sp. DG_1_6_bins_120]
MGRRGWGCSMGLGSLLVGGLMVYGYTLAEDPVVFAQTNLLRLQLALWLGKDANRVDEQGKNALFFVESGRKAQLLLKHGAQVNQPDWGGAYPLHQAARRGNPEVTKVLLQAGAEVNARFGAGGIPLHFAAWSGNPEVVKLLLEQGAAIDEQDGYGLTPLDIARDLRRWEAARVLSRGSSTSSGD